MAFDGITIANIAQELNQTIVGGKINKIAQPENDELLLTEYLGSKPDQNEYKHFLANKIYVDYLWTLWAKTRVPYDGQPMEDWAVERYARLKDNLRLFAEA